MVTKSTYYWFTIPEREGWLLVPIDDKKVGAVITFDPYGRPVLGVAGYHMGKSKWIGQQQNVLSIMVEKIPKRIHGEVISQIRNALSGELKNAQISFVDDRYFSIKNQ